MKTLMIICTLLLAVIGIGAICVSDYWCKRYRDEYERNHRWEKY